MSNIIYTYECVFCKKTSRVQKDDPIPYCCGNLMQRIDHQNPPEAQNDKNDDAR